MSALSAIIQNEPVPTGLFWDETLKKYPVLAQGNRFRRCPFKIRSVVGGLVAYQYYPWAFRKVGNDYYNRDAVLDAHNSNAMMMKKLFKVFNEQKEKEEPAEGCAGLSDITTPFSQMYNKALEFVKNMEPLAAVKKAATTVFGGIVDIVGTVLGKAAGSVKDALPDPERMIEITVEHLDKILDKLTAPFEDGITVLNTTMSILAGCVLLFLVYCLAGVLKLAGHYVMKILRFCFGIPGHVFGFLKGVFDREIDPESSHLIEPLANLKATMCDYSDKVMDTSLMRNLTIAVEKCGISKVTGFLCNMVSWASRKTGYMYTSVKNRVLAACHFLCHSTPAEMMTAINEKLKEVEGCSDYGYSPLPFIAGLAGTIVTGSWPSTNDLNRTMSFLRVFSASAFFGKSAIPILDLLCDWVPQGIAYYLGFLTSGKKTGQRDTEAMKACSEFDVFAAKLRDGKFAQKTSTWALVDHHIDRFRELLPRVSYAIGLQVSKRLGRIEIYKDTYGERHDRPTPVGFFCYSKPGVGKSFLIPQLSKDLGYPGYYSVPTDTNHWSGASTTNTEHIVLDEFACNNEGLNNTVSSVISLISCNEYQPPQAEVAADARLGEGKGMTVAPKIVSVFTNLHKLETVEKITDMNAFANRFNLCVEAIVREPFRLGDTTRLDPDKVPAGDPYNSHLEFKVYSPFRSGEGRTRTWMRYSFPGTICYPQLVMILRDLISKRQRQYEKAVGDDDDDWSDDEEAVGCNDPEKRRRRKNQQAQNRGRASSGGSQSSEVYEEAASTPPGARAFGFTEMSERDKSPFMGSRTHTGANCDCHDCAVCTVTPEDTLAPEFKMTPPMVVPPLTPYEPNPNYIPPEQRKTNLHPERRIKTAEHVDDFISKHDKWVKRFDEVKAEDKKRKQAAAKTEDEMPISVEEYYHVSASGKLWKHVTWAAIGTGFYFLFPYLKDFLSIPYHWIFKTKKPVDEEEVVESAGPKVTCGSTPPTQHYTATGRNYPFHNVKRPIMDPVVGVGNDITGRIEQLKKNMVYITCGCDITAYGYQINYNTIISYVHGVCEICKATDDCPMTFSVNGKEKILTNKEYTLHADMGESDVAVYTIPPGLFGMPKELKPIPGLSRTGRASFDTYTAAVFIPNEDKPGFKTVWTTISPSRQNITHTNVYGHKYKVTQVVGATNVPVVKGFCGCPAFAVTPGSEILFFGPLVAGRLVLNISYYAPYIPLDDNDGEAEALGPTTAIEASDKLLAELKEHEGERIVNVEKAPYLHFSPTKTGLHATNLDQNQIKDMGLINIPDTFGIASLTIGDPRTAPENRGTLPCHKRMVELATKKTTAPQELKRAKRGVHAFLSSVLQGNGRVLTDEEAVVGVPGKVVPLDLSTAVGAPLNRKTGKFGGSGKRGFIKVSVKTEKGKSPVSIVELDERLREEWQYYKRCQSNNDVPEVRILGNNKDEVLPYRKIHDKKTRIVWTCPIALLLELKKQTGWFAHLLAANWERTGIMIGCDLQGPSFHRLLNILHDNEDDTVDSFAGCSNKHERPRYDCFECGVLNNLNWTKPIWCGDYEQFDISMHPDVLMAAFDIIRLLCQEKIEGFDPCWYDLLIESLLNAKYHIHDIEFQTRGFNPSGNYLTTIVNSIVSLLYLYSFVYEKGFVPRDTIVAVVGGDDNAWTLRDHFVERLGLLNWHTNHLGLDGQGFSLWCQKYGMNYTTSDKVRTWTDDPCKFPMTMDFYGQYPALVDGTDFSCQPMATVFSDGIVVRCRDDEGFYEGLGEVHHWLTLPQTPGPFYVCGQTRESTVVKILCFQAKGVSEVERAMALRNATAFWPDWWHDRFNALVRNDEIFVLPETKKYWLEVPVEDVRQRILAADDPYPAIGMGPTLNTMDVQQPGAARGMPPLVNNFLPHDIQEIIEDIPTPAPTPLLPTPASEPTPATALPAAANHGYSQVNVGGAVQRTALSKTPIPLVHKSVTAQPADQRYGLTTKVLRFEAVIDATFNGWTVLVPFELLSLAPGVEPPPCGPQVTPQDMAFRTFSMCHGSTIIDVEVAGVAQRSGLLAAAFFPYEGQTMAEVETYFKKGQVMAMQGHQVMPLNAVGRYRFEAPFVNSRSVFNLHEGYDLGEIDANNWAFVINLLSAPPVGESTKVNIYSSFNMDFFLPKKPVDIVEAEVRALLREKERIPGVIRRNLSMMSRADEDRYAHFVAHLVSQRRGPERKHLIRCFEIMCQIGGKEYLLDVAFPAVGTGGGHSTQNTTVIQYIGGDVEGDIQGNTGHQDAENTGATVETELDLDPGVLPMHHPTISGGGLSVTPMVGNMMRTQGGGAYNTINPGSMPSCNMTRPFIRGDEGNLDSIMAREVIVAKVRIAASDVTGKLLYDESLGMRARVVNDESTTWTADVAYCDVLSTVFTKWQGTFEYTIYFTGSKFHKVPLMFAAIYGTSTRVLTYEEVQYQSNGQVVMSADLPAMRVRVPFQSTFPELYTGEVRDDIPDPLLTHVHVRFMMFARGPLQTVESVADSVELVITKRFCGYVYHLTGEGTAITLTYTPSGGDNEEQDEAVACGPDRNDYTPPVPIATLDLQTPGPVKHYNDLGRAKDHTEGRENQRVHSLTEMYRRLRIKTRQWSLAHFSAAGYEVRASRVDAAEMVGTAGLATSISRGPICYNLFSAAMGGFHFSLVATDLTQRFWVAYYPGVGIDTIKFETGRFHFPMHALADFRSVVGTVNWLVNEFDASVNGSTVAVSASDTLGFAPIQPSHQGVLTLHVPMTSNRVYNPLTPGAGVPNGWLVCLAKTGNFPIIHMGGARDFQLGRFNGLRAYFAHGLRSPDAAFGVVTPSGQNFLQLDSTVDD